jgi:CheY-like chemotaxis protein
LPAQPPMARLRWAKLPQLNPDLVTLDIEMPELDGLATLPELRKAYPKLPVIMFSTLTERGRYGDDRSPVARRNGLRGEARQCRQRGCGHGNSPRAVIAQNQIIVQLPSDRCH